MAICEFVPVARAPNLQRLLINYCDLRSDTKPAVLKAAARPLEVTVDYWCVQLVLLPVP